MITTFVAVRHGETEWNKIERQQGHRDSPLTALGKQQAAALAAGLKTFHIDLFFSSDLGRARETADVIGRVIGLNYETDERLRERHLGVLQGLTYPELEQRHPGVLAGMKSADPDYRIPGGESARERMARNVACLEDLAAKHPGKAILVVCHGGVLRSFIDRALDLPPGRQRTYSLANAAINVFSVAAGGIWRLETWGETAHLRTADLPALDDA